MGDLWGMLLVLGQIVAPFVVVGLAAWFLIRYMGARRPAHPDEGDAGEATPAERRRLRRTAIIIAVSGTALPWLVGLAVKTYLDAVGEPTYAVSSFLAWPVVVVLLLTTLVLWCSPFLALAWWTASRRSPRFAPGRPVGQRVLLVWTTFAGGMAAGLALFYGTFRQWDALYAFVPLGAFLAPPMVVGYMGGLAVLQWRARRLRRAGGAKP
jgi:hypothetical protein